MIFKKVPANEIDSISGTWKNQQVQPRISANGWGILPIAVLYNVDVPENIKSKISTFEDYEFDSSDFPPTPLEDDL